MLITKEDGICTLTINRPEKRNAFDPEIMHRIQEALRLTNEDGETRVVVLRGAGDKAFSAGYDVSLLGVQTEGGERDGIADLVSSIEKASNPVIAMIHGYCIGGGLALAAACDFRLADTSARFGITAAKLGAVYPPSALRNLINVVGVPGAKQLLMTGRLIDAEEAARIRLVSTVVPTEKLAAVTYALAAEIVANSTFSVRGTKKLINKLLEFQSTAPAETLFFELQKHSAANLDLQEGKKAFFERRHPQFKKD